MRHLVTNLCIKLLFHLIDLKWFDHIVPCGIEGKGVTSLSQEMNRTVGIQETQSHFFEQFEKLYSCRIIEND